MQADEIKFGSELQEITESIYLPESLQKFGIEKQVNDLLDELLSTIPNNERTFKVLNEIHRMISRFKELRQEFSIFDEYNNAIGPKKIGSDYKPLVNTLEQLNQKLYWILPVSKNKRKIYNLENINEENIDSTDFIDIIPLKTEEVLDQQKDIYNKYLENDIPEAENKYIYLQVASNNYDKPYKEPSSNHDVLVTKEVNTNILSVVNNLEEYKSSSINNNRLSQKRFYLQTHLTGNMMLETEKKNNIVSIRKKQITPNDDISIKSIMTLQEPTIKFSRINLPTTNIATRSNLNNNFLNYWLLLHKNTTVSNVFVNDVSNPIELDENKYLKEITEYLPNISEDNDIDYRQYLEAIIPRTRVLFNMIKNNINNNLSIFEILKYMEPFMIYNKDISFKQYQDFVAFIKSKIVNVKSNYITNIKSFNNLQVKSSKYSSELLNILRRNDMIIYNEVLEAYNIPIDNSLQDSEIYNLIINIDNGKLYNNALSLSVVNLMVPNGLEKIDEFINNDKKADIDNTNTCETNIIAKKYIELDELEQDDGVAEIYFDKKYDPTYYEIKDEYKTELEEFNDSLNDKIIFLSEKLQKNNGFKKEVSIREARAIIENKRLVQDGEYAILEQLTDAEPKVYYYKRDDNKWIYDENIDENTFTDNNKVFCNLNEKCISIKDMCENVSNGISSIERNNVNKILNEFDLTLEKNMQIIKDNIKSDYKKSLSNIKIIININDRNRLKNNEKQYDIGLTLDTIERIKSPYEDLRDSILGQQDFVKKQNDITKFVRNFTRPNDDNENEWWLYCIDTNIKLLPTFINKLASAFVDGDNYMSVIDDICANQGEKSDDDSYIVDKYSGYNIKAINFDVSEGYTQDGYKIKSRDILEAEFNHSLVQQGNVKKVFESPETEKIYKISNAIAKFIGINLEPHIDFITRNTVITRNKTMPSKENYDKTQIKKKKIIPYEKALDLHLIIITLSYFIIAIQTSIPSVKTRKKYPGCIKSFSGYPISGEEDLTGITYIACITNKIKSSVEPWDAIRKTKTEDIVTKITTIIKKSILNESEVKERINEKILYNKLNEDENDIPESLSIKRWTNFLPLLYSVKLKSFQQVSKAFIDDLKTNYKNSSKEQDNKINTMRGKIIYSVVKIQELIQAIISKKKAILTNNAFEPFLENACCDSDNINTLKYFIDIDKEIAILNNDVVETQNILDDLERLKKANTIFIPNNTKLEYPNISSDYSEETIYKAFIYYCKFNSNIPIFDNEIRSICNDKPSSFNNNIALEEQIIRLKNEGFVYSKESLYQLLNVINKRTMEPLTIRSVTYSNIITIKTILDYANENDIDTLPRLFIDKFTALLDNYEDGELMEDTKEMEEMKNYLYVANENMRNEIIEFISKESKKKTNKKIIECINTISDFNIVGTDTYIRKNDETIHKMINFIKTSIKSISKIFPSMIINNVDYRNVIPPSHWKLSNFHKMDFNRIIKNNYEPISSYKNDSHLKIHLNTLMRNSDILYQLSEATMFNTPIIKNSELFYSVFDRKMCVLLFQYYFYSSLKEHIRIIDDTKILSEIALIENDTDIDVVGDDDLQIEIEILSGEKISLAEKIASLLNSYATIICTHKRDINFNHDDIIDIVHRASEKEKKNITDLLKNLTESEREIENMFKKHKLEKWSKGLKKGLRVYQSDTYDEERKQQEQDMINDIKTGNVDAVTDIMKNIYTMENTYEEQESRFIEDEELTFDMMPNDDDYGDNDGDEQYI